MGKDVRGAREIRKDLHDKRRPGQIILVFGALGRASSLVVNPRFGSGFSFPPPRYTGIV